MANNDIKQKIVLDGEKEYKQALKDAQRELKTLRSELKAETAELGKNASEQEKARVKAQNLKKQIEEQKKVVDTYKKALEEVREKYADDEDAIAKWEQKLNEARATLANMKNDLENVGDSFKKNATDAQMGTVAAKSYADALGTIANAGQGVADAIEGIFSGMINIVRESIGAIWEDLVDLAARSNAWGDLAGFWNTNAANVEKWDRAVTGATDDFSDLTAAVLKINNLDDKQQKKIAELTGVSGANYTDRWEYATKVLSEMAKMPYDKMLKASEEIFGAKRATGVLDLLNDWEKIEEGLIRFDAENGGLGLNDKQIQDMVTLDERIHTLQETWKAFVDEFEAEHFGKLALDLTGNAQAILDAFIEFMDADNQNDRDAALKKIEENVKKFFTDLGEALSRAAEALDEVGTELQGSENGIVRLLGNVLTGLSDVLEWFTVEGNVDKVIKAFEALAAFWLVGNGVSFLSKISSLAANLKLIQGFSFGGSLAGAAGTASNGLLFNAGTLATALSKVTLSVGLVAMAVPVVSLFKSLIIDGKWPEWLANPTKTAGETIAPEASKETQEAITETLTKTNVPGNKRNALRWGLGSYFGQDVSGINYTESNEPIFGTYNDSRRQALENYWDYLRTGDWEGRSTGYEELLKAFEGEQDALNDYLDRMELLMSGSEWQLQKDLPADWWKTGGADENGITHQDVVSMSTLPDKTATALGRALSGLRIDMDGYTVAKLTAPMVSQIIARDIE